MISHSHVSHDQRISDMIQHCFKQDEITRPLVPRPRAQEANVDGSHVLILGLLQKAIQVNMASF